MRQQHKADDEQETPLAKESVFLIVIAAKFHLVSRPQTHARRALYRVRSLMAHCAMGSVEFLPMDIDWTALGTLALATTTVWLAIETRHATQAATKTHQLEARPYLAFKDASVAIDSKSLLGQVSITLNNPGRVLVFYRITQLIVGINGVSPVPPKLPSTTIPVYPGSETFYYSDAAVGAPIPTSTLSQAVARFKLEYWSAPEQLHTLEVDVKIHFALSPEGRIDTRWMYVSDPIVT